jgi:nicotinamidase-related amidase
VIHARIQSLTNDGRERSLEHKRLGIHAAPGSKEAEFLPEVAPKGDEIIIPKSASGIFNSTNIEYILRNLGVEQLVVVGVVTSECVETAVRDASDRSFVVYVPEDGVAAINPEIHEAALKAMHHTYAYVMATAELLGMVDENLV